METFQKLKIMLPQDKKDSFLIDLRSLIDSSHWKPRNDLIENYKKNTFTNEKNILCFESEEYVLEGKNIQGLLWLWDYSGYYEVFNIVPTRSGHLEFKEYNYILNRFFELFIKPLIDSYGAEFSLSKPEKFIIDTIGENAFGALNAFSTNANKTTGNTHAYDFERWCEFIFIIFKNNIQLSSNEFYNWLMENGWDDEMATKLERDFEYSLDLLEKYEQNK